MMFQKMMYETGPRAAEMERAGMEGKFEDLRRRHTARKNRATSNHGLFYRKSPVYRHV